MDVHDTTRWGAMMAVPLRVDPVDLHMSSDHLDVHHADLRTAHTSADATIEAAQSGWVGTSAAALHARFAEWQAASTQLCGEVQAHGAAFRAAAQSYEAGDADSADELDSQL